MLISDLMRWLRVDLFFERSKRFIRWFIRLLPLRKINEELWFFTFLLSFVSSNKLARQGLTDANRSIPNRKTGTEPSSQKDGPSMCPGFLHRFSSLVSGWIVYGNSCSEQGLTQESKPWIPRTSLSRLQFEFDRVVLGSLVLSMSIYF